MLQIIDAKDRIVEKTFISGFKLASRFSADLNRPSAGFTASMGSFHPRPFLERTGNLSLSAENADAAVRQPHFPTACFYRHEHEHPSNLKRLHPLDRKFYPKEGNSDHYPLFALYQMRSLGEQFLIRPYYTRKYTTLTTLLEQRSYRFSRLCPLIKRVMPVRNSSKVEQS